MDVTPTDKMFAAMKQIVDATCGEEPSMLEIGPGAARVRGMRTFLFEALHRLVAVSMREGVNRKIREVQARREAGANVPIFDAEDAAAAAKARDDAEAGISRPASLTKPH